MLLEYPQFTCPMLDVIGKLTKHGIIVGSIITGDMSNLWKQMNFFKYNIEKETLGS